MQILKKFMITLGKCISELAFHIKGCILQVTTHNATCKMQLTTDYLGATYKQKLIVAHYMHLRTFVFVYCNYCSLEKPSPLNKEMALTWD